MGRQEDPRAPSAPVARGHPSAPKRTIHAVLHRHGLVAPRGRPRATGRPERRCQTDLPPMSCSAPTSMASSSSATDGIDIPSPSQITPRDISCFARPSSPPARTSPSRHSSASFASGVYPMASAPITAFPSPAQMASSISPSSPCDGCAWVSTSSASNQATPSRTACTSACTSL